MCSSKKKMNKNYVLKIDKHSFKYDELDFAFYFLNY